MIVDAIVNLLFAILEGVLALIPSYTLPDLGGFGSSIGTSLDTANSFFPVAIAGACLLAVIGAKIFLTVWDVLVFVYRAIPFKAT